VCRGHYPFPIVEPTIACSEAAKDLGLGGRIGFAELPMRIQKKHGPRRSACSEWGHGGAGRWAGSTNNQQLGLNLAKPDPKDTGH